MNISCVVLTFALALSATGGQITSKTVMQIDDKELPLCEELKRNSSDRYNILRNSGKLAINRPGNNIDDVIGKYIQPGINFSEAEQFLKDCGFNVHKRPGNDATGSYPDRYDVYATLSSFTEAQFWMQPAIVINLTPSSPQDYATVKSTYARIQVTAP